MAGADGMYSITKILSMGNEFKVVAVSNNEIAQWYPATGANYQVTNAAYEGEKEIRFSTAEQTGEGWFGGCIFVPKSEIAVPEFYITGDAALTAALKLAAEKVWAADALPVMQSSYTMELPAGSYRMKITLNGTWNEGMSKGINDLTERAAGLVDMNGNIGFALAEAGRVQVTYGLVEGTQVFKLSGNFVQTPLVKTYFATFNEKNEWVTEDESNVVFNENLSIMTVNIAKAKTADWQGQVFVAVPFVPEVGKSYDVSMKMKANKAAHTIYMKYHESNVMFEKIVSLVANEEYVISESNIEGKAGNGIFFFDFRQIEEDVAIQVYDVVITEHQAAPFVPADSYTVAGEPASVFGTTWAPALADNDMVRDATAQGFIYTWKKQGVEVQSDKIAFKVVANHAWTDADNNPTNWPADNYEYSIPEVGIYTIEITFNAETKDITVAATKTGDVAPEVPNYYLIGSMTNWQVNTAEQYLFGASTTEGVYVLSTTLANGDKFKVVRVYKDGSQTWYPDGTNNDFVVDAKTEGQKTIFFRPDGQGGEGWHYGVIYVEPNVVPEVKFTLAGDMFDNWAGRVAVYEDTYVFENLAAENLHIYQMKVITGEGEAAQWHGLDDMTSKAGLVGDLDNNICFIINPRVQSPKVTVKYSENEFTVTGDIFPIPAIPDGYYLYGNSLAWYVQKMMVENVELESLKLARNTESQDEEYAVKNTFIIGDELQVAEFRGNSLRRLNAAGAENAFVGKSFKIEYGAYAGEKTLYFRPQALEAWKSFSESGHFWMDPTDPAIEPAIETIKLYVVINIDFGWQDIFAYIWKLVEKVNVPWMEWPGIKMNPFLANAANPAPARVAMMKVDEKSYIFECPKDYDNIIFSNGSGEQTADLTVEAAKPVYVLSKNAAEEIVVEKKADIQTDIDNIELNEATEKLMLNGQIYILKGGKIYNVTGQLVR